MRRRSVRGVASTAADHRARGRERVIPGRPDLRAGSERAAPRTASSLKLLPPSPAGFGFWSGRPIPPLLRSLAGLVRETRPGRCGAWKAAEADRTVRAWAVSSSSCFPAYNEEENLPRLLADFASRAGAARAHEPRDRRGRRLAGLDGRDRRRVRGRRPVELVRLGQNQGPGAAFRAGFDAALAQCPTTRSSCTLEADTTSDLDALPVMLERAAAGADLVLASWVMVNVEPAPALPERGGRLRGPARARARGDDRLVVLPRLSRVRAARGVGSYGERWSRRPASPARRSSSRSCRSRRDASKRSRSTSTGTGGRGKSKMPVVATRSLGYWRMIAARSRSPEAGGAGMSSPAVAIVGGGILGMTAAYRLAQAGVPRRALRALAATSAAWSARSTSTASRSIASTTSILPTRRSRPRRSRRSSASATGCASGRRRSASTATAGCSR